MKSYIDRYISGFSGPLQQRLVKLADTIRKAAPGAEETMGYGIPTFKLEGNLVHFAAFKNHIGFYPGADGIAAFSEELAQYKGAKGSVQFPHEKKLPLTLIRQIVKYRVKQNLTAARVKQEQKNLRTCAAGHRYVKSSDCPVCPLCEKKRNQAVFIVEGLSAPARRALEHKKIRDLKSLSKFSEKEILTLHGIGPSSLPRLRAALKQKGLSFRS